MKKKEIGEFLCLFYRKKTTAFLSHVYRACITGNLKDIHRARLDVKRIFELYSLFEMLDPTVFKHQGGFKLFRPLYRQAGKIREIQVNYLLLENPHPLDIDYNTFNQWQRKEEQKAVQKFIKKVKQFKEAELMNTDKMIEIICYRISIFKLRLKTTEYIKDKAEQVKNLQLNDPDEDDIHKIRKILKAMATISTLVYSVKSGKWLDEVITILNKTEMMIGDWHDRVILKKAIERFMKENYNVPEPELNSLILLKQNLTDYNLNLVQHFMPEVSAIVDIVLK
ncbi:MAG: CHAD domain-containing protein [Bacteroidales bacterium]|nr:CHAD domain-containing protein [Bacteroidales bacterium]